MSAKTRYIYGTEAEKLYAAPKRRPEQEEQRRPERKPATRPQPKQRVDKVSVLLIALTFAVAFGICFSYIQMQSKKTMLSKSVVSLESEVMEMEKTNSNASQALQESLDLSAVYKKATKELGMKTASQSQIYTYESKKSTQVRLHQK